MRTLLLLLCIVAVAGCAEAVRGPRVVIYSDDMLYIRHLPWRDSRSGVALLAEDVCAGSGRTAALQRTEQYAWLDIRYATFRCTESLSVAEDAAVPGV